LRKVKVFDSWFDAELPNHNKEIQDEGRKGEETP
jgi:hypothetical protein